MKMIFKKLKNKKFPCIYIKNEKEFLIFRKYCLKFIEQHILYTSLETLDSWYYEFGYDVFTIFDRGIKRGRFLELKYDIASNFEILDFYFFFKPKFLIVDEKPKDKNFYFSCALFYQNPKQTNHFFKDEYITCV